LGANLKIAINAASAKMGGAVTYLAHLLRHLPRPESGDWFFVFLPGDTAAVLPEAHRNVSLCPVPRERIGGVGRIWWQHVTLRRFLRTRRVDVLLSTANFATSRCPVKQILLVRNALYFSEMYQQMFLGKHGVWYRLAFRLRRWLIWQSVRSADVVMTPTQAMLDELRGFVDVPPHKALVNPYGIDPPKALPSSDRRRKEPGEGNAGSICKLLYVSLYGEHKNLRTLLKAIPLLNKDGAGNFLLQTTADPAWEGAAWAITHAEDIGLARRPEISPWVRFVGPLSREHTENLYRDSDIFIFPSLAESFGFPMAEAMSYGLPIVASDTPVNREICGDAAVYFSPLDPGDLARQVQRVAADVSLRRELSAEGVQRARTKFCWNAHVRRILEIASPLAQAPIEEQEAAARVQ
jgi:glycosyltransferase involved in cell wall biosynthesis